MRDQSSRCVECVSAWCVVIAAGATQYCLCDHVALASDFASQHNEGAPGPLATPEPSSQLRSLRTHVHARHWHACRYAIACKNTPKGVHTCRGSPGCAWPTLRRRFPSAPHASRGASRAADLVCRPEPPVKAHVLCTGFLLGGLLPRPSPSLFLWLLPVSLAYWLVKTED